jgi:hypothetical protein
VGRLDDDEQLEIAVMQIEAGLAKLADPIRAAGLAVPDTNDLRSNLAAAADEEGRARTVWALHVQVLSTVTATDFRLGKAYGLDR